MLSRYDPLSQAALLTGSGRGSLTICWSLRHLYSWIPSHTEEERVFDCVFKKPFVITNLYTLLSMPQCYSLHISCKWIQLNVSVRNVALSWSCTFCSRGILPRQHVGVAMAQRHSTRCHALCSHHQCDTEQDHSFTWMSPSVPSATSSKCPRKSNSPLLDTDTV